MRVIVCGGRNYNDIPRIFAELDHVASQFKIETIVHGGASGADAGAEKWAAARNIPTIVYRANWNVYGPKAGPMRNERMAVDGADLLVAFPGGAGTANMIKQARLKKIVVKVIS